MTNYFPTISDNHANTILEATSTGLYLPFATNVQVKTDLGMQTVPTRTNSIRNNSMVGAVAGTPGTLPTNWGRGDSESGIVQTVVGTGTENGLPYIDIQFAGTANATQLVLTFDTSTAIAALTGQQWTGSYYYKLIGGSTANVSGWRVTVYEWTSGGAYVTEHGFAPTTPDATMRRAVAPATLSGGGTVAKTGVGFNFLYSVSAAINFTIRLYAPQLEGNAVSLASPPILTTSSAVTVPGNIQNYDFTGKLANGFTGYIKLNALGFAGLSNPRFMSFNDGTFANRFILYYNGTSLAYATVISNASIAQATNNTTTGQQIIVFACGPSYQNARIVGQGATTPLTGSYPSGLTKLTIGGEGADNIENIFQYAQKIVMKFGAPSQATFDAMYNLAQLDTIPAYGTGADFIQDYTNGSVITATTDVTDTHSGAINALISTGTYTSFAANVKVQTDLGQEIVPSRTNMVTWSRDLTNANWAKTNVTVTTANVLGPDGTTSAGYLTRTSTSASFIGQAFSKSASNIQYTYSRVVKADTATFYAMRLQGTYPSRVDVCFDLTNGIISLPAFVTNGGGNGNFSAAAASITPISGGFYLCQLTATSDASTGLGGYESPLTASKQVDSNDASSTARVIYWNCNLEAAPFASPPILNTTASALTVSGNQVVADLTGKLTNGFAGFIRTNILDPGVNFVRLMSFDDGTSNNVAILVYNAGRLKFEVWSGGVNQAGIDLGPWVQGDQTIVFSVGPTFATARILGGVAPTPTTSLTYPSMSKMSLTGGSATLTNATYQQVKKVVLKYGVQSQAAFDYMYALAAKDVTPPAYAIGVDYYQNFTTDANLTGLPDFTDPHSTAINYAASNGVFSSYAANTKVVNDLGIQTSPTATNAIRNNSGAGSTIGTMGSGGTLPNFWGLSNPTGANFNIVGSGTENGLTYVDVRPNGTTVGGGVIQVAFEVATQIAVTTGTVWTQSFFVKLVAGTLTGLSNFLVDYNEYDSGVGYLREKSSAFTPANTFVRQVVTGTLGASTAYVQPYLKFTTAAATAIDATFRIYAVQMEQSAFATPPILTTSAAVTVTGNFPRIDLTGKLTNGFAFFMKVNMLDPGSNYRKIIRFTKGATTYVDVYFNTGDLIFEIFNNGSSIAFLAPGGGYWPSGNFTIVGAAGPNFAQARIVGRPAIAANTSAGFPTTLVTAGIGGNGVNGAENLYQQTQKLVLKYGAQNQASFDAMYALALQA